MCGIAGVYLLDDSLKVNLDSMLDTLLDEIDHRGGDATGFVALGDDGVVEWQKASCDARTFAKERRRVPEGTRTILAHTRWATQGSPAFIENNHPLKRGSFFAIHNGHVSNDHKLFELAGRERFGRVDSEAIPARLASLGKLDGMEIVMEEIEGAAAVAAVDDRRPRDLALAKGYSSPLFVLRTKKIVLFGSTPATVTEAYEKHVGKLPKKAAVENVKTGTLLLWREGVLKRSKFSAYEAPKVTYKTGWVSSAWTDVTLPAPKEPAASTTWDPDQELVDCDSCGETMVWSQASYRKDPDEDHSWQFCHDCVTLWDEDGGATLHDRADSCPVVYDDYRTANEAILDQVNTALREAE